MTNPPATETRGRPQLKNDDEILTAALDAFATAGYDAMSLRSLNRDLGLSHGTVNQRFGSKDQLFTAAVDKGFGELLADIEQIRSARPHTSDERDTQRETIRAFLIASARRPQLVRLMNSEGITPSDRLDRIYSTFIEPTIVASRASADSTLATREWFFLVVHGAAAPFTLHALSTKFDDVDGSLSVDAYADRMSILLTQLLEQGDPNP